MILLLTFAYFWIGLTPFGYSDGKEGLTTSGNLLNQVAVVLLSTIAVARIWLSPSRSALFAPHALLILILVWFSLTSLISFDPMTAFRRIAYALLVCGCANAALLLPRTSRDFAKVILTGLAAVLFLNYVSVLAMPIVGIHGSNEAEAALAGDWRGIFGHKNTAAAGMVYIVFLGLYLRKTYYPKLGTLFIILAAVFLVFANGKTSTAMLPLVLVLAWLFEHCRPLRLLLTLGLVIALNVILIGSAGSETIRSVIAMFGIDATFTGRGAIWKFALDRIAESPFTGYGFQIFWGSDFLQNITTESWVNVAAHSHNSFLETLINGGIPALLLVILWILILPLRDAGQALANGNDRTLTRLFLRIWIFSILLACLENFFFLSTGPIWFATLLAVFGMRLQARASLRQTDRDFPRVAD